MTHPLSEPLDFDGDPLLRPGPRRARFEALSEATILAGSHSVSLVAQRLGISRREVRTRIAGSRLLGIKRDRELVLPAFQFTLQGLLPGLEEVLAAARPTGLHPVSLINFLRRPTYYLSCADQPLSPIEWLMNGGEVERVVPLVRALGQTI